MKLTLGIPVMNQLEDTKGVWGTHINTILNKHDVELVVIDNGSTDGTDIFLRQFVFPYFPHYLYHRNPENVGMIASLNQIVTKSHGDVICILHNDLYVYGHNWTQTVINTFDTDPSIGMAGFLGARGCGSNGGRIDTMSNLLEAETHGRRVTSGIHPVAIFDGLSLIGRRTMFEQVGGFDTKYAYHHFYDRDIALESHTHGWKNVVIPISCHHRSGVTANRPDYQEWIDSKMQTQNHTGDQASYNSSDHYFSEKWAARLPIIV